MAEAERCLEQQFEPGNRDTMDTGTLTGTGEKSEQKSKYDDPCKITNTKHSEHKDTTGRRRQNREVEDSKPIGEHVRDDATYKVASIENGDLSKLSAVSLQRSICLTV
jgi:hypothetical protein